MGIVFWYMCVVVGGYFIGSFIKKSNIKKLKWLGPVQMCFIVMLLIVMGIRLGANPEVIDGLGGIGVIGIITSLFAIAGSVMAVFLTRKLMGINDKGEKKVE